MYSRAVQRVNNIKIAQNIAREKRPLCTCSHRYGQKSHYPCPSAVLINYYTFFSRSYYTFFSLDTSGKSEHSRRHARRNGTRDIVRIAINNLDLKFIIIENCLITFAIRLKRMMEFYFLCIFFLRNSKKTMKN